MGYLQMAEALVVANVEGKFRRIISKDEAADKHRQELREHRRILADAQLRLMTSAQREALAEAEEKRKADAKEAKKRKVLSWSGVADQDIYHAVIRESRRTFAAKILGMGLVESQAEADRIAKAKYPSR
jgi:hypothetical protein